MQELFAQAVAEKDPGFFQRLNDSRYLPEDKHVQQRNALFCDPDYKDKDYYKAYPTIYHLRKALMEEDGPFDVRLVYLAVHHIIKHRGHFLFDSLALGADGLPDSGKPSGPSGMPHRTCWSSPCWRRPARRSRPSCPTAASA